MSDKEQIAEASVRSLSSQKIDFDMLYFFTEHSERLDEVERFLRKEGQTSLADYLLKLQQDMALELDWSFNGRDDYPSGPETARLWNQYEQVTMPRLLPLKEIAGVLRSKGFDEMSLKELDTKFFLQIKTEVDVIGLPAQELK